MSSDRQRFEAAERGLWAGYDIVPTERWIRLASGTEVRIQEVGRGEPVLFLHGAAVAGSLGGRLPDET